MVCPGRGSRRGRGTLRRVGGEEGYFGERVAARYDDVSWSMFDPALLAATVGFLEEMAGGGAALECGIGTGRVAVPVAERAVRVAGIDNSEAMLERLRAKTAGIEAIV